MPRDYYEVLGVVARRRRGDDQEVVPPARARAAPGRQRPRPRGRGEVQGGRRGLRGALRRRAAPDLRRLRPRGPEDRRLLAQLRGLRVDQRPVQRVLRAGRRSTPRSAARGCAAGPCRAATSRWRWRSTLAEAARGTSVEVTYDATAPCETCHGNGAEPGTPIVTCDRCRGAGQIQAVQRTRFGQMVRTALCDKCGGDGRIAEQPCHTCDGRGMIAAQRRVKVDIPAGIDDGQRLRITGRGHAGERGGPAGDLYVVIRVKEDERFIRDREDLVTVVDVAGAAGRAGHHDPGADARRRGAAGGPRGHAAGRDDRDGRPRAAAAGARPHRRPAGRRQRRRSRAG